MFCSNCGNPVPDGARFCANCGTPVAYPPAQVNASEPVSAPVQASVSEESSEPQVDFDATVVMPTPTPEVEEVPVEEATVEEVSAEEVVVAEEVVEEVEQTVAEAPIDFDATVVMPTPAPETTATLVEVAVPEVTVTPEVVETPMQDLNASSLEFERTVGSPMMNSQPVPPVQQVPVQPPVTPLQPASTQAPVQPTVAPTPQNAYAPQYNANPVTPNNAGGNYGGNIPPVNGNNTATPKKGAFFIGALVLGIVFAIVGLIVFFKGLGALFGSTAFVFSYLGAGHGIIHIITTIFMLMTGIVSLAIAAVNIYWSFNWDDTESKHYFNVSLAAGALLLVAELLYTIFHGVYLAVFGEFFYTFTGFNLFMLLLSIAFVPIVFGILCIVGMPPRFKGGFDEIKNGCIGSVNFLIDKVKKTKNDAAAKKNAAAQNAANAYQNAPNNVYQGAPNNAYQPTPAPIPSPANSYQQSAPYQGYVSPTSIPPYAGPVTTGRGLFMMILLSFVTCGIYSYYWIYKLAHDMNIVCSGDGEKTSGLIEFILLSIITCGIYALVWYYKVANRMCKNAPRYGMTFTENGTSFLLWYLFGSLLCGVGFFVSMHIICKNANALCGAYSNYYANMSAQYNAQQYNNSQSYNNYPNQ